MPTEKETSSELDFEQDPKWRSSEQGTSTWCMQKMYYLLQDPESLFFIGTEGKYQGNYDYSLEFSSAKQGRLMLFLPSDELVAYYEKNKKDKRPAFEDSGFESYFEAIKQDISQHPQQNCRYILPICESGFKGYGHIVTMILDYDSQSRTLTPTVYDSIGRGTVVDELAQFFGGKKESTADTTLNLYLKQKFPRISPITRIAYDHQNRRDNYDCGLYAFRVIKQAVVDFWQYGLGLVTIPGSINISDSDTNFLTKEHIQEIHDCVNHKAFNMEDLFVGFNKLRQSAPQADTAAAAAADVAQRSYDQKFPELPSLSSF